MSSCASVAGVACACVWLSPRFTFVDADGRFVSSEKVISMESPLPKPPWPPVSKASMLDMETVCVSVWTSHECVSIKWRARTPPCAVPMLSSSMRSMKNSPLSCGENGGTPGLVVDTTAVEPLPVKAEVSTASSGRVPLFPVNVTAHVRPFWLFTEAVTEACSKEGEGERWEGSARRCACRYCN